MRLIDADALVEAIKDYPYGFRGMIVCDIAKQPTIDVPDRKVWKWVEEDDGTIHGHCSSCGWKSIWQETDVFGMNYCPNCGARMERSEE